MKIKLLKIIVLLTLLTPPSVAASDDISSLTNVVSLKIFTEYLTDLSKYIIDLKTVDDTPELGMFVSSNPPDISVADYVSRFMVYLFQDLHLPKTRYSNGEPVYEYEKSALVYSANLLWRFIVQTRRQPTPKSIHRILAICFFVAQRNLWDDHDSNKHIAKVVGITTLELKRLEIVFLTILDYNIQAYELNYRLYLHIIGILPKMPHLSSDEFEPEGLIVGELPALIHYELPWILSSYLSLPLLSTLVIYDYLVN